MGSSDPPKRGHPRHFYDIKLLRPASPRRTSLRDNRLSVSNQKSLIIMDDWLNAVILYTN